MTPSWPGTRQYETHRNLLSRTSARPGGGDGPGSLDAIIVPASRPAANLDHAVTLARALRCQLVVICSHFARPAEVDDLLASRNFSRAIVVDLPADYTHAILEFRTSTPAALDLPAASINPNVNLSTKRNLGLLLARMLGWGRVFFLDDDIRDLSAPDLYCTASMLGPYRAVGMRAVDFPDNSVVCHGHRRTGGNQDVFISGSVLAVDCTEPVAFFPEIYNEDWFFFYHYAATRQLGWSGRDATQLCYDPFADPKRAAGQEFGDVMAEGLYSLLHHRNIEDAATGEYWRIFLAARMRFLEGVLARAEAVEPYLRRRIVSSIETAMEVSQQISPSMCERYVSLWKKDLAAWQQRLMEIPLQPSVKAALSQLSLTPSGRSPYVLAGIIGGSRAGASRDAAGQLLIPPGLAPGLPPGPAPGMAAEIQSLIASQRAGLMADGSQVENLPPAGRRSDVLLRGVTRMSRRASDLVRRAITTEEHPEPAGSSRNGESGRLPAGKHRKAAEPSQAPPSPDAVHPYPGHQPFLAPLGSAYVRPPSSAPFAAPSAASK